MRIVSSERNNQKKTEFIISLSQIVELFFGELVTHRNLLSTRRRRTRGVWRRKRKEEKQRMEGHLTHCRRRKRQTRWLFQKG